MVHNQMLIVRRFTLGIIFTNPRIVTSLFWKIFKLLNVSYARFQGVPILMIVVVSKFIITRGFWVFLINVLELICRSCR